MKKKSIIIEYVILIALIFCTILAPRIFSKSFVSAVFAATMFATVVYFKERTKFYKNFLDFEPLFVIISLIMGFLFPLLIFSSDSSTPYSFSWGIPFSLDYINKGACITAVGTVSFMLGCMKNMRADRPVSSNIVYRKIKSIPIFIFVLIILSIYITFDGFGRYREIYQNGLETGSFVSYLEYFIIALLQVLAINEAWNKKHFLNYKANLIYIITIFIISLSYLIVGNRTFALYLFLPLLLFYTTEYFNIKFFSFIFLLITGLALMIAIMFVRSSYDTSKNYDWFFFASDLMIPNTNTYLACEISDKYGHTFGVSMISSLLLVIPFAQTFVQNAFGISRSVLNSADIFTVYLAAPSGTGTNYLADSYLAFGLVGVVLFPYLFGKIFSIIKARRNISYYYSISYYILCGFAIYFVRSSFLFSLRFIIYGIIIAYINRLLYTKKIKQ